MLNPDKYVRKAFIDALTVSTGLPVWENGIPRDQVLPDRYIILHSQTKQPFSNAKGCFEWLSTIVLDLNSVNEKGFQDMLPINDLEETVLNTSITVPNFKVRYLNLINSQPLNAETPTQTINRQVLNMELWLDKA